MNKKIYKFHSYHSTFKFLTQLTDDGHCRNCYIYCEACGKPIEGFVYRCEENGCNLHPYCFNLPSRFLIEDFEFMLCDKVLSKCILCNKKKLKGSVKGNSGWSYVSTREEYNFHVYCTLKMLQEAWKDGDSSDNNGLVPGNLKLPIEGYLKPMKGNGNKYFKIVKMFLELLVSILLGDLTITLASMLVELFTN
ncbi:hypothetical protein Pint_06281 [Pistacia integerrima]|uniref:Uncharacterized protein n=1 Tax=Pistacia integerrima TaxID=434235 RepID=A0ACC0Z5Y8_9ROSI|nr:hypothetical protein Pint_06281 [Pistacia integerrima]